MSGRCAQDRNPDALPMDGQDGPGVRDMGGRMVREERASITEEPSGKSAAGDRAKVRARGQRGTSDESELARVVRQVWLSIATGGWWTLNDVRSARPSLSRHDVAARLSMMAKKGFVESRELPQEKRKRRKGICGPRPRYEYCVTPECRVPSGLTAGEVSRALTGA